MPSNWRKNNTQCHPEQREGSRTYVRSRMRERFFATLRMTVLGLLIVLPLQAQGMPATGGTSVLELNQQIQDRRKAARELQARIAEYRKKIATTQKKAASLTNQINILESNIAKTELEIRTKEVEIEQLGLEAQLVEAQMEEEEGRMEETLEEIGMVLRRIKKYDDRPYLEIILARDSFSEVFNQLYFTERLGQNLKARLDALKAIRATLEENGKLLAQKRGEAEDKKEGLTVIQLSFEQEKRLKALLLGETRSSEREFQRLLTDLREAEAAIDADIVTLEKTIRERLDIADKLGAPGVLSWPVAPIGGISAGFHDSDYPFRYIFEHAGIDIRTPQGTPVRAAASGYIAKTFNGGLGIRPSYVMLVHGNQLSTVYMHLSSIAVAPDTFVARGDIIGRSGGTPRTAGAGRWSTGPHVHFETRLNGVPVDPMGYLP